MDKNILLGIIVIIVIIYMYNNLYDQFQSINENYENIVKSKYSNIVKEKTYYETYLNTAVNTINYLPIVDPNINLNDYAIYNNTTNFIASILSKKRENNQENKKPTIFEEFYERVMSIKPITVNSKSLIENASNATSGSILLSPQPSPIPPQSRSQNGSIDSQFFGINIIFWTFCFVVSVGVIYVIIQNGDRVFKTMGFNKISKMVELTPTESSLVDSLSSPKSVSGGNNIYYTGGYDINLYSE
jgi:uncharacterized membrane protein